MRELPPIRCYYLVRNSVYFWLYEYRNPWALPLHFARMAKLTLSFLLRAGTRRSQLSACLRGWRDGLFGKMDRRY
jgi:hypothetical protein